MMEQELLREHCQAYLLGALEGDERDQIQRLLDRRDPECLAALEEARELVAQVAFTAPVFEPPSSLRTRVLSSIAADPQKVVSIARPGARRNYQAWTAWAVAAALLVAAFVFRTNSSRLESDLAAVQARYEELRTRFGTLTTEAAYYKQAVAIIAARNAVSVRLASTAPEAPQFRAYWAGSDGLVLLGSNVPAPAAGRALQLWVLPKTGDKPIPAGVFQPDQTGRVLMIATTAATADVAGGLAISDEPSGGSPQPTTTPGWIGKLSD